MIFNLTIRSAIFATAICVATPALAAEAWMDTTLSPDQRAALLEKQMTPDERISILHGVWPVIPPLPEGAIGSAGYIAGVPRLGIPALQESDAGMGVTNPLNVRPGDTATALPAGLSTAATFDVEIAHAGGSMIGREAAGKGFNVMLAGGINLARDPRNGRNFEYLGEDPLLAGMLDGEIIRGIQDQHVISTIKHFAINDQETGRHFANVKIDEGALRESDLLAFQIAIERGKPGSVMCSYNLIDGAYACGNNHLLNDILKRDWKYPGWVMSDWGAVYDLSFATAGLDQESGQQFDKQVFFDEPLKKALAAGTIPAARVSDMARRILRSMFANGLFDHPVVKTAVDLKASADVAQKNAEEGIVLLKNSPGLLPLAGTVKRIAVIGGHSDSGVLSGGGSGQVVPVGGASAQVQLGGFGEMAPWRTMMFDPSSPMKALAARYPNAEVRFDDGRYPASAAKLAQWADVVVIFATQWMMESYDAPDISLPDGQDALIQAVAAANPKTIVVLETGGPVLMPWLKDVGAVLEAWYPGQRGGEAIANILSGDVNPSGHLPVTFPQSLAQNPRPELPGADLPANTQFDVVYSEGSAVGYRWFAQQNLTPLFPFGFGLSYSSFSVGKLQVSGGKTLTVSLDVTNTGAVAGATVPQVYLTSAAGSPLKRLIGFSRVMLAPGETKHVTFTADPRLLARFDVKAKGWRIAAGTYGVSAGTSSADAAASATANLSGRVLPP